MLVGCRRTLGRKGKVATPCPRPLPPSDPGRPTLAWPGPHNAAQGVIQFLELMLKQKPRVCLIGVDHGRLCNINSSSMTLDQESDDGVGDVCDGG